jgi:hypothetical protein
MKDKEGKAGFEEQHVSRLRGLAFARHPPSLLRLLCYVAAHRGRRWRFPRPLSFSMRRRHHFRLGESLVLLSSLPLLPLYLHLITMAHEYVRSPPFPFSRRVMRQLKRAHNTPSLSHRRCLNNCRCPRGVMKRLNPREPTGTTPLCHRRGKTRTQTQAHLKRILLFSWRASRRRHPLSVFLFFFCIGLFFWFIRCCLLFFFLRCLVSIPNALPGLLHPLPSFPHAGPRLRSRICAALLFPYLPSFPCACACVCVCVRF